MKQLGLLVWGLLLLLSAACESPAKKIARLQHEFLENLAQRDSFSVGKQKLPLPLSLERFPVQKQTFQEMLAEIKTVSAEKLGESEKKRLNQLSIALTDMLEGNQGVTIDPMSYVLPEKLVASCAASDANTLESISAYYAEVEHRWQRPNPARAKLAAEQSRLHYYQLERLGEKAAPACFGLKDFIGMCQSAVLAEQR